MANLGFLLNLCISPFLSLAIGVLLFADQPTTVRVVGTIFTFLLLFFGSHEMTAMWLRARARARAIKYETALLSSLPDNTGRRNLDIPYEFGLGVFGHILCIAGITAAIFKASMSEPHWIFVGRVFAAAMLVFIIGRTSKASPFFAPALIASREGIRSGSYLIPWTDVVNAYVSSGKGAPLYVETARGRSSYRVGGDGREVPYELTCVEVPALGMWAEDLAQYLLVRARLSCEHPVMNSTAGADRLAAAQ